jgi:Holliday junction resolvase RusA-like endonuclease
MLITIPGKPVPKKSTKFSAKQNFRPYETQQDDIDRYAMLIKVQARGFKVLTGAVHIDYIFIMPIPKSTSKKKRALMIGTPHIKRPDKDNLEKFVNDRLSGIVFKDDSQIASDTGKKIYGEEPRTELTIKGMNINVTT